MKPWSDLMYNRYISCFSWKSSDVSVSAARRKCKENFVCSVCCLQPCVVFLQDWWLQIWPAPASPVSVRTSNHSQKGVLPLFRRRQESLFLQNRPFCFRVTENPDRLLLRLPQETAASARTAPPPASCLQAASPKTCRTRARLRWAASPTCGRWCPPPATSAPTCRLWWAPPLPPH